MLKFFQWGNWYRVSWVLYDRKIRLRIKGLRVKTAVRLMYGAETWAAKKAQENKSDLAEKRMLRWMCGVTRMDRVRNERIRGTTKVGEISKKMQNRTLKRDEEYVQKRLMRMDVEERKKERKTEVEVDGQYKCGPHGEGNRKQQVGNIKPINVGNDALEEEGFPDLYHNPRLSRRLRSFQSLCSRGLSPCRSTS